MSVSRAHNVDSWWSTASAVQLSIQTLRTASHVAKTIFQASFLSGHDFSYAENATKGRGFSPLHSSGRKSQKHKSACQNSNLRVLLRIPPQLPARTLPILRKERDRTGNHVASLKIKFRLAAL